MDENITPEKLLQEVNKAIATVLVGGQSYKIGSRELTRADLKELKNLKNELIQQIQEDKAGIFDNMVVAVFDGR